MKNTEILDFISGGDWKVQALSWAMLLSGASLEEVHSGIMTALMRIAEHSGKEYDPEKTLDENYKILSDHREVTETTFMNTISMYFGDADRENMKNSTRLECAFRTLLCNHAKDFIHAVMKGEDRIPDTFERVILF